MNTRALFCLSLLLVMAGCAQQTSTSSVRDGAFAQSLRPAVVADIYQRAPEVTRSGRYTLVNIKSTDAQRDPLSQLIAVTLPGQLVTSVRDGFRYLLFQSGYSLCGRYGADFAALLKRPLPAIQRKMGPVRLSEALQVVAGPAWRMSVDEVNREVCFVLRDAYQSQARAPVTLVVTDQTAPATSRVNRNDKAPVSQLVPVPLLLSSGSGVNKNASGMPPLKVPAAPVSQPVPRNDSP